MHTSLFQETVIQEDDHIRLRIVGTRVDANDIVSIFMKCQGHYNKCVEVLKVMLYIFPNWIDTYCFT